MRPLLSFLFILAIVLPVAPGCKDKGEKYKKTGTEGTGSKSDTPSGLTSSIHDAAYNGDLSLVSSLLEQGCKADTLDIDGRTPLMFAAFNGHTNIVKRLLEGKANINMQDMNGRTALMMASSGPFAETVRLLLTSGADPNITDKAEHFTALMYAGSEGQLEVVKVLLAFNADPYMKDIDGDDVLDFANKNNHGEIAQLLKPIMEKRKSVN